MARLRGLAEGAAEDLPDRRTPEASTLGEPQP